MPTPQNLRAAILASEACLPHVHLAEMPAITGAEARAKDQAVADILNAAATYREVVSRTIGIGTVLDTLGAEAGALVLDSLTALSASIRPLHYAMILLDRGDLDVGLESVRNQINALTPTVFTPQQAQAILALAEQPITITAAQVSIALRGPWGDE